MRLPLRGSGKRAQRHGKHSKATQSVRAHAMHLAYVHHGYTAWIACTFSKFRSTDSPLDFDHFFAHKEIGSSDCYCE